MGTITPDSKSLLVLGGKTVHLYDLDTGKEVRKWDFAEAVVSLAVSRDGKQVATGHADKAIRVWDFATGKEVCKLEGHEVPPAVVFSPDGKQLLSAAVDKTVRLWDLATGKEVRKFEGFKDAAPRPGNDLMLEASFVAGGRVVGHVWGRKSEGRSSGRRRPARRSSGSTWRRPSQGCRRQPRWPLAAERPRGPHRPPARPDHGQGSAAAGDA